MCTDSEGEANLLSHSNSSSGANDDLWQSCSYIELDSEGEENMKDIA